MQENTYEWRMQDENYARAVREATFYAENLTYDKDRATAVRMAAEKFSVSEIDIMRRIF